MKRLLSIKIIAVLFLCTATLSSCGLLFGLFYKDWKSETAYKSPRVKGSYYQIKGVTQSHCGCSDLMAEGYENKKLAYRIYYGGGLYPPAKYIYRRDETGSILDTVRYTMVSNSSPDIAFEAIDKEILGKMDTLARTRPAGAGLIYEVKIHTYTGFRVMLRSEE